MVAMVLLAGAIAGDRIANGDEDELEKSWRQKTSKEIAATIHAVGVAVVRLEALSSSIGDEVVSHAASIDYELSRDPFTTFGLLDSIAATVSSSDALPAGTQIGIQVFDRSGSRVSWSGWPQSIERIDEALIQGGVELIYSRKVSLYRILTHLVPVHDGEGKRVATVVIDMPLEVDYRVNNRFLKSASLADNIVNADLADVSFGYFPAMGNLPGRLPRFKRMQDENRARRLRRIAARTEPNGTTDSVLTYYDFPDYVAPAGDIAGDTETGLRGRAIVHSPQGNPVIGVTAVSHPYRHDAGVRAFHYELWVKTCIVLALMALFGLLMARLRAARQRTNWLRAALFVVLMVVLRYALLSFGSASPRSGHRIFDPTVFATPTLGGLMRSPGDLLITAVFFVVALYGLVKIARSGAESSTTGPTDDVSRWKLWIMIPKALMIAGVFVGVFELSRRFTNMVVVNSNPRLIGETMKLASVEVIMLQLSLFLMLTGILLTGIFFIWAIFRITRTGARGMTHSSLLALVIVVVIAAILEQWEMVLIALPVLLFTAWAPRFTRREDLVSFVSVAFCLVVISSGIAYLFLAQDYDELRKSFVLEKSAEMLEPSDNWKVVILEDLLTDLSRRPDLRQNMRRPGSSDMQRMAFDLWAEGALSLLGYSCAIHVLDAEDKVVSDFSVDMPYRARITEGGERIDTPDDSEWAVLDLTRTTPQGIVRFYRGVLNVFGMQVEIDRFARNIMGKVIIDVPFFFENLALAARTGPRTPELLRNVQEGSVAPRIEEPEALLLARMRNRQIRESSSEKLPVGTYVSEAVFERAREERWPLLRAGGNTYRVVVRPTDDPDQHLLAGFAAPSLRRHLLRWSTLFSLHLLFAFVIIVMIVLLSVVPQLDRILPTLTPGRRLGFQQKLLASFLAVALIPAIILGLFAVDFIKDRFVQENEDEALYKVFSARRALVNILHGELQFFLDRADMESVFSPNSNATKMLGEHRIVKLFADTGDVLQSGFPDVPVVGVLHDVSAEELFVVHEDDASYVGVVSAPVRVTGENWDGAYYLYYAREIDEDFLGEVADQVGADVNIYDGGDLVASSSEGLLAGGFISSVMNSRAFVKVSMFGSDHSLSTERAGRYQYQVAYLPVNSWGDGSQFTATNPQAHVASVRSASAAMSVPLVFRPESYYLEVQKATSIILGIFALLFTATIALGLVLARGIFEPLHALLGGTRRISQGDFNVRLPERRQDEIGTVVRAFNEMTQQIARSQRTLEERRRYLETILQNIGTGVVSTDHDDRVRTVNAAAQRILEISVEDVRGRTAEDLVRDGRAPEIFSLLRDARRGDAAFVSDEIVVRRGERKATVKYMLTRLEHEGRYQGTVFVLEDVTELIQSKKLSAWVEMARQIAHEIKNPLTPIRISTQFMQRAYEQKSDQFERIFNEGTEMIMEQVEVLRRIAGEFSSYGRMQQLKIEPRELDPMIRGIVSPYIENKEGVRVLYDNGFADARVLVDPEAVRKICSNLIENAFEAMPNGGELRVSFVQTQDDAGRPFVSVAFRDSGPGLSGEVEDRLFEPYFSTKTTGTGLGLAICRTLSQEMGGDVTVRNVSDGVGVVAALTMRRE